MNDRELDDLLNTWSAPAPPALLRERARAGYASRLQGMTPPAEQVRRPAPFLAFRTMGLKAAGLIGAGAFLFLGGVAFTQIMAPRTDAIPYVVDSEYYRYGEDGSRSLEMYSTSYTSNGYEVLLDRSVAGTAFGTLLARTVDITHLFLARMHGIRPELGGSSGLKVISGCDTPRCLLAVRYSVTRGAGGGCVEGELQGKETILGYETTAVRQTWPHGWRMTLWTTPELGCFALKALVERQQPDSGYRPFLARQATRVVVNRRVSDPTLSR